LCGKKDEPLWPNLARESSRMRRKFLKYLSSLYLQHILLKKRIQGTLRPIFYSLIPAGRSRSRDWRPPCSLVQKWATQASPFKIRLSDMTEIIYICISVMLLIEFIKKDNRAPSMPNFRAAHSDSGSRDHHLLATFLVKHGFWAELFWKL